jgi:signal transduction histidine kinase
VASRPRTSTRSPEGKRSITVRTRMTLLLALTVCTVTFGFLLIERSLSAQLDLLVREHVKETSLVLRRVLDLRASGAAVHADDYTRWDDFVAFARNPDPKWGQLYLTENISTFAIDVAWAFDDHIRLIFTANPKGNPRLGTLPVSQPVLAAALRQSPIRHFFAATSEGVLELWTSSIQPSADLARKARPAGYYMVGRLWTPERIGELANLLDGEVTLAIDGLRATGSTASSETGRIRITLPFRDIGGTQVAVLDYATNYPAAPRVHDAFRLFLALMIGGAFLLFAGVSFALTRWVAHPLALITESLRTENPSLLTRSIAHHDEYGSLAQLVRDFFAQKGHLIEAREASEAAALAKQQFLANISHELRTPMHGIISYSRFGAEDAPTATREELADYFKQIASSGATLLALLDDLLDLAKFDSGRMRLEIADLGLEEVAHEAVQEFATIYAEKRLTIDVDIESSLSSVRGDRMRLLQVFRNLLSNAAKFTPAGEHVGLRVSRLESMARVTVEDPGKGIPPGELETVFDRFSQASNNRRGGGGTGLGLPLCREIIEMHGGRIWAENRAPHGTRMIFEVPFAGPGTSVGGDGLGSELSDGGSQRAA